MRKLYLTIGLWVILMAILFLGMPSKPAQAVNLNVCDTCVFQTIQEAIDVAQPGDTIRVAQGVYHENLVVDKRVVLEGGYDADAWTRNPDHESVIDGGGAGSVVRFLEGSDGSVLDSFTVRNGEAEKGGGILIDRTQATVRNCQIVSNTAYYAGGGIAAKDGAFAVIRSNNVLSNLSQESGGAGLLVIDATATVDGNLFAYNISQASWGGDALGFWDADAVTVTNNVVVSNTAKGIGTGVNVTVVNNTIAYNSWEGLFVWEVTAPMAVNNIVVNNYTAHEWSCDTSVAGGGRILVADYNNVGTYCGDAVPGLHDISADPLFVDTEGGDFHLLPHSPCVDAGTNDVAPTIDFEGDPRPDGCFVDIGADELALGRGCFRTYLPLVVRR